MPTTGKSQQRLVATEAHREKREAISGHVEGSVGADTKAGAACDGGFEEHCLVLNFQEQGVDVLEHVVVALLEVVAHVAAVGDHEAALEGHDGGSAIMMS